jgi:hypothetical protein
MFSLIDNNFREELQVGANLGVRLGKLISALDTQGLISIQSNSSKKLYGRFT